MYDPLYSKKTISLALAPKQRLRNPSEWFRDRVELEIIFSVTGHGCRLLDVGCGAGRLAIPIVSSGISVVGIDVSTSGVRLAHSYDEKGLADFIVASMNNLPFRREIFDSAIVSGTFEYVKELSSPMIEISEVIKQLGTVYFHMWNARGLRLRRILKLKLDKDAQEFELDEIRRQMEHLGMKLKRDGGLMFFLPGDVKQACRKFRSLRVNQWWVAWFLYRLNHLISNSSVAIRVCPVIWSLVTRE